MRPKSRKVENTFCCVARLNHQAKGTFATVFMLEVNNQVVMVGEWDYEYDEETDEYLFA